MYVFNFLVVCFSENHSAHKYTQINIKKNSIGRVKIGRTGIFFYIYIHKRVIRSTNVLIICRMC